LRQIFDDRRTPGAPEALRTYLREVAMDTSPTPSGGRLRLAWDGLGRTGRAAASLAVVAVVVAGALAFTMGLPRGLGVGAGPTMELSPIPTAPPAPPGWTFAMSFGNSGGLWVGARLVAPVPRIAVHVICKGSETLAVFAGPEGGPPMVATTVRQAALFQCQATGQEGRAELTSTDPAGFQEVDAIAIGNATDLSDTIYVVSVEVPAATPEPSVSP
jgi:hypothetical protein